MRRGAAVVFGPQVLRQRKATPAELARYATEAGTWETVRPYLEALTIDA